jgi:uncharacterized protein (TIGR02271 family)
MTNMPYTDADPIIDWADKKYTLRDVSGDKIGELVEVNPDYVIAESDGGFLGLGEHRQYYVPRSAVTERDGTDWYLSITKDQVESMDWREAPSASRFATDTWRQHAGITETTDADAGRTRLVRYEEELQAQKVSRQAGEVTVGKDVVQEVQSIDVPVRREEVRIERRPVTDQTSTDTAFSAENETIRVPVMEEDVEVSKVVRPVEEVVVSKQQTEETRQVSDTVRKERFDIRDDQQHLRDREGAAR